MTVLADLIDKQTDPTLAPYAKVGEVTLRLSTKATSQEEADLRLNQLEDILQRDKLREYFYAYGEENSLVQTVATGLVEKTNHSHCRAGDRRALAGRIEFGFG